MMWVKGHFCREAFEDFLFLSGAVQGLHKDNLWNERKNNPHCEGKYGKMTILPRKMGHILRTDSVISLMYLAVFLSEVARSAISL